MLEELYHQVAGPRQGSLGPVLTAEECRAIVQQAIRTRAGLADTEEDKAKLAEEAARLESLRSHLAEQFQELSAEREKLEATARRRTTELSRYARRLARWQEASGSERRC